MTISGTATSITVDGDALTSIFSYDFYMGGSSAYAVLVYIDATGAETTIVAADFTITGVTSQSGGTFTYPLVGSPIAVGTQLRLSRVLPYTQNAAVGNQGSFYPSVVEGALDNLEMQIQQLASGSGATIDASSLFGNSSGTSGAGSSIPIGSGLSFSGNTLVVSGISGSGTVTLINTGTGLSGGPITGIGTVTMSTITTGMVLGNFSGATAAPQGVAVTAGAGITLSSTTTSLTIATSGGGGMTLITTSIQTGTTSTITFNSIPQTYTHLEIRGAGRSTGGASAGVNVAMTFNNDGGANYDNPQWQLVNATGGGNSTAAQTSIPAAGIIPWSSSVTSNFGAFHIQVQSYTSSVFKNGLNTAISVGATSVDGTWISRFGGFQWRSTAAITRIDLILSAGSWTTGSKVSLYGLA